MTVSVPTVPGVPLCDHFGVATLAGYGCDAMPAAIGAAGAALSYAEETQKSALPHVELSPRARLRRA